MSKNNKPAKTLAQTKKLKGNRGEGVNWRDIVFKPGQLVGFKKEVKGYPTPLPSEQTEFFVLNPLKDLSRALDTNVSAFQNILIEFDKVRGLVAQEKLFERVLGIPFTCKTFSGGKSLHYIISLAEPVTLEEWRDMVAFLLFVCKKADAQCKNPARLTRTPNAVRGGIQQTLIHCEPKPIPNAEFYAFLSSPYMLAKRQAYEIQQEKAQALREVQRAEVKASGEPPAWVAELLEDPTKRALKGSRHATIVSVAVALYSLGFDPVSYIEPRLLDLAEKLDKSEQEVYSIINWVERNVQLGT